MIKLLSIIIPTYNMEAFLDKCLSSLILENKEDRESLDVIIVNDGSKDKSLEIAQSYERQYPEMFSVIDKVNGNYGSCINAALPRVKGKYVRILDADDSYYTENLIEYLHNLAKQDVDMILNDYITVDSKDNVINTNRYNIPSGKKISFNTMPDNMVFAMHAVAYRSSIFKEIDYFQTEGVSYTDMEWIFHPLTSVRTIFYYAKPIYRYLLGRDGQTVDTLTMIKRLDHREKGLWSELKIFNSLSKCNLAYKYLERMIHRRIIFIYINGLSTHSNFDLNSFDNRLKQNSPYFYNRLADFTTKTGIGNFNVPIVKIWRRYRNRGLMLLHPLYAVYILTKIIRSICSRQRH